MRKLRSDITLKEAWEWIDGLKNKYSCEFKDYIYDLAVDVARADRYAPMSYDTYPDSFYEQSPVGSFGNFGLGIWGYLVDIDMSQDRPYSCVRGTYYSSFTPGLPQDVDGFGYPKADK